MFVLYVVQLGVAHSSDGNERDIYENFNFITNAGLAFLCLVGKNGGCGHTWPCI